MKKLVELVKLVRVEGNRYTGINAYFEMEVEIDGQWIELEGDYISVDASPIYNDLDGIYPEDIAEGKEVNMEILRDLTGLSKSKILKELKALERVWIEKFRDINGVLDSELTAFEAEVGGEC